ncbi:hypothetical protein HY633_05325 [Candidatus Uhrbacteria bacterium]|nr:hypothetical protein [Candidatus Uhrbacteria bacterium]
MTTNPTPAPASTADGFANAAQGYIRRALRSLGKQAVIDTPVVNAVVRALDPDIVEFIYQGLPAASGLVSTWIKPLVGESIVGKLIVHGVMDAGEILADLIREGHELTPEKVGEVLTATLKKHGEQMVWVDTIGNVHPVSCDTMLREPDNRKRQITLLQAVADGRSASNCPVCNKDGKALTMPAPATNAKQNFRGKSVAFILASMEGGMSRLEWIMALDKPTRDRIIKVLQEEADSPEEIKVALDLIEKGADINDVANFLADSNPTSRARRNVANAVTKVTDAAKAGVAKVQAFDAGLAPEVTKLRDRVSRNRNKGVTPFVAGSGKWAWLVHALKVAWNENKAELKFGAVVVGAVLLAALFI